VGKLVSHIREGHVEDVSKQSAEKSIWVEERGINRTVEKITQ
jgi:hypothetical protein